MRSTQQQQCSHCTPSIFSTGAASLATLLFCLEGGGHCEVHSTCELMPFLFRVEGVKDLKKNKGKREQKEEDSIVNKKKVSHKTEV